MIKIIKLILLVLLGLLLVFCTGCGGGIYSAVDGGDVEAVTRMLAETPGAVGVFDEEGRTLLHRAALQDRVKVAQLLLDRGAKVNERSRDGNAVTPLHLAAHKGHLEMAKLLMRSGADVNLTARSDFFRWDTLSFAIEGDHKEMVEFLLGNGASAARTGTEQVNPLLFAAYSGNVEIAEMLLANGAEVEKDKQKGGNPLHEAVYMGNREVVELLLRKGADVNKQDKYKKTPLHLVLYWKKDRPQLVELLLEHGADVNALDINKNTPLHNVAYNDFGGTAALLMEKGASPGKENGSGRSPLAIAKRRSSSAVWKLFKSLHTAAQSGDQKAVADIVKRYPQLIRLEDDEGKTPLHLAVEGNRLKTAETLIANGADVNTRSKFKKVQLLSGMVAKILVPKVGRIKYVDDVKTPLKIAGKNGFTQMVRLLKTHGAVK